MIELSVLIPTYNDAVFSQVCTLHRQLETLSATNGLHYEIIVVDDCSTDEMIRQENEQILQLSRCRLVCESQNMGRAASRNRLSKEAQFQWLLFVDAALFIPDGFVEGYVRHIGEALVVCGGCAVDRQSHPKGLRYKYELDSLPRFSATSRSKTPFRSFRTNNFMIARELLLDYPMQSDIRTYGYEDVLFGKTLEQVGVTILHIDNPVIYSLLENNTQYINKVVESIHTLYVYRDQLIGYSPLLDGVEKLCRMHLVKQARWLYSVVDPIIRHNLIGKNPSLLLFKVFKIGTYLQLSKAASHNTTT